MIGQTALVQCTAPIRCTSTTSWKSASSILAKLLSRRMPALLIRMSMRPQASIACLTMACTAASSVTEAPLAIASPPAALISSTTACAAVAEPPEPSTEPPRSLTTTLAPRAASSSACWRPRPPPAPVTIATRPVKSILGLFVAHAFNVFLESSTIDRSREKACRPRAAPTRSTAGARHAAVRGRATAARRRRPRRSVKRIAGG